MDTKLEKSSHEKRLLSFESNFKDMEDKAGSVVVNSAETKIVAGDMIASAKKLGKEVEGVRTKIYNVLYPKENRSLMKKANELAKGYQARIKGITGAIEKKYLDYDREERRKAAEAEAAALKDQEDLRKEAEKKNLFIPPELQDDDEVLKSANIPKVSNKTVSALGTSYRIERKSFKVVDFSKIPDEFKMLNETLIRKEMNRENRRDIPGIEWVVQESLGTRTS